MHLGISLRVVHLLRARYLPLISLSHTYTIEEGEARWSAADELEHVAAGGGATYSAELLDLGYPASRSGVPRRHRLWIRSASWSLARDGLDPEVYGVVRVLDSGGSVDAGCTSPPRALPPLHLL